MKWRLIGDIYEQLMSWCHCRSKSLGRRHTMSGASSSVSGLSVHSWFAASPLLTKCIWSTAVAQHQFYIDIRHTVSLIMILAVSVLCVLINLQFLFFLFL